MNLKKYKNQLFILGTVLLFILIGIIVFYLIDSDEKTIKLSDAMLKPKVYDGLEIVEVEGVRNKDENRIKFTAKNNSNVDYEGPKESKLVFFDKTGRVVHKCSLTIPSISANSVGYFDIILDSRWLKSYDFIISDE